jgi:hypothetical protein
MALTFHLSVRWRRNLEVIYFQLFSKTYKTETPSRTQCGLRAPM